jgi:hypothetical protein
MLDPGKPIPHKARVDAALEAAEHLEAVVRASATELGEDGAQPHLIAALAHFETALRTERMRLATKASGEPHVDQQALAV